MSFVDHEGQAAARLDMPEDAPRRVHVSPRPDPQGHFRRMLEAIPPSAQENVTTGAEQGGEAALEDASAGIALAGKIAAMKASEARRDAILAVALAIKRRGGNPLNDWTVKDTDTAYAIAEQLLALSA